MINKVILVGNVGQDPDVRSFDGGVKVARLRVATTERIYDQSTKTYKDHTEWHTVTLWRGLADVVDRYVRKGSQIYVEGSIHYRDWQGNDGQRHFTTEITASELKLLGRRADGVSPQQPQQLQQPQQQYAAPQYPTPQPVVAPSTPAAVHDDDDLPF
jgi:single-strand DNA-binding protein